MNVDSAAVFLAGTILYALGGIIILIGVVIANNILHKYWKSFGWRFFPGFIGEPARFAEPEEIEKLKGKDVRG